MRRVLIVGSLFAGFLVTNLVALRWPRPSVNGQGNRFQHMISDLYWIRGYDAWLKKDKKRLLDDYAFSTALNPKNLSHWRLAAQTIAYDFPVWDREAGNLEPESTMRVKYAEEALAFFERSRDFFEKDVNWYVSAGFISETALGDPSRALDYLAEAVALPNFTFLAGRTYARLLMETGELDKAHTFLVRWTTNANGERNVANNAEIRDWIRSLEAQLKNNPSH